jgi:hypothetical protein
MITVAILVQEGQVAKKGGEDLKLALTATQLAHERELQVKLQQAQKLTSEVALLQVRILDWKDEIVSAMFQALFTRLWYDVRYMYAVA